MRRIEQTVKCAAALAAVIMVLVGLYYYLSGTKDGVISKGVSEISGRESPSATTEYLRLFGNPPDVGMIRCEAFVAYYPSEEGNSYVPLPFFITSPDKRDSLIAGTLVTGLPTEALSSLVNPLLPGKWTLLGIEKKEGILHFRVKGDSSVSPRVLERAAGALFLTYSQFYPGISGVRVEVEGGVVATSDGKGLEVGGPGPPAVIDAFLVKKGGEETSRELRVLFDRPVMIRDFAVRKSNGDAVRGKVFLAEFSMAAVLDFDENEVIGEGDRVDVSYSIHDYLGRAARGVRNFVLREEVESH